MSNTESVYRKLQLELDKMPAGCPATGSGAEIKLLKHLYTPEEAEFVTHLSMMKESFKHLCKRMKKKKGMSQFELETILDRLEEKGLIFSSVRGDKKYYSKPQLIVGIYELQLGRLTKEFVEYFNQYEDEILYKEVVPSNMNQVRTIPVEKSLTPEHNVSTYDDIRYFIEGHHGSIAVMDCICRIGSDLIGEHCKLTDLLEVCISFDGAAENFIKRGDARPIDKKECFKILDKAEAAGLVLQPSNSREPVFICCCCGDCCAALKSIKKFPRPAEFYNNNFFAQVNQELCIGCEKCLKRCQMEAITIVDKKSTVNLERCIGCGLCVVTCPKQAIQLYSNKKRIKPPKNTLFFYIKVLYKKYGFWKILKMGIKVLFKKKI
ncbi:MAG: 4Fe-4S binding protein [Promethearchaeota archaeon]